MTVLMERPAAIPDVLSDTHGRDLDELFRLVDEKGSVPAGYRVQIIDGEIVMSPQRPAHSKIISLIQHAVYLARGTDALVLSDVRVDFPGALNGYCPDVLLVKDRAAEKQGQGGVQYTDLLMVCELVSAGSRAADFGAKVRTYAAAAVPVYVVVDLRVGRVLVNSKPRGGRYRTVDTHDFGEAFTLPGLGIRVDTKAWPPDESAATRTRTKPDAPAEKGSPAPSS